MKRFSYFEFSSSYIAIAIVIFAFLLTLASCENDEVVVGSTYHFIQPQYDHAGMQPGGDTIRVNFGDTLNHKAKSLNLFNVSGTDYLSIFDDYSDLITIFNIEQNRIVTQFPITRFIDNKKPFYSTIYIRNFDSILIFSYKQVQIFDTSGRTKAAFDFKKRFNKLPVFSFFDNRNPVSFAENKIYTSIRPYDNDTMLKDLREAKAIYEFDFNRKGVKTYYNLPESYHSRLFGFPLLRSSYCLNDKKQFILSFAADSNIYVTNLADFHLEFYAKSRYQINDITSPTINEVWENDGFINYLLNDAYGAIYYDNFKCRYLRVAEHKINIDEFKSRERRHYQSIIIMDSTFKIIGESKIDKNINLDKVIITSTGKIYAHLISNPKGTVSFVSLNYH